MAKLPGFTADLGQANAPAAPNPAVVEAAYAAEARGMEARAKQIEIAGAKRAEGIGALAKLAETGYTFAVEREAAARAQEVVDKLNEPKLGFVGATAQQASDLKNQAMSELQWQYESPATEQLLADYNSKAREINAAAQQNMLSQQDAQLRLASEMKKLIATHPAMAERVRKVFNSYTGRGDWDIRPVETALTAKAKEDQAAKDQEKRMHEVSKSILDKGIAGMFGVRTYEEIYQNISQGTDAGVKMQASLIATNLTDSANKSLTTASMNEFANQAFVAGHAARVKQSLETFAKLKMQGIDFDNPNLTISSDQYTIIRNAFNQSKVAEERAIQGALASLAARRNGPEGSKLDANIVEQTINQLTTRLRTIGATNSIDDMLNSLKADNVNRNQTIDTLVKSNQIMDATMARYIPADMRNRMLDPRQREAIVAANPGNKFIKTTADIYARAQDNFSEEYTKMLMISDGLFNSAASAAHRAAALEAKTTTEGRDMIAQVTQARMIEGATILGRDGPATPNQASTVVTLGEQFSPQMESFQTLKRAVLNKGYEVVLGKDTPASKDFVTKTSQRIEYLLSGGNPTAAGNVLKSNLAAIPGASLIVVNGRLGVTSLPEMDLDNRDAILTLDRSIETVNSLILMQDTLLGTNNRARLFVSPPSQMQAETPTPPPEPATEPNVRRGQTLRAGVEAYINRPQFTEPRSTTPNLDSMTPGVNPLATQGRSVMFNEEEQRRIQAMRGGLQGGANAPTQTPTTPSVVSTTSSTTPWWRQQ